MSDNSNGAIVREWLLEPLPFEVSSSVERLRALEDVQYVAVMPDCHLAAEVCNGCVLATSKFIYPDAVGGDIGCGMAAVAFDCGDDLLKPERAAARVLAELYECIPVNRYHRPAELPERLDSTMLCHSSLEKLKGREGKVQFGTLGRGNHFVEFQCDEQNRLWLMVHSGSRAMGQAIRKYHVGQARMCSGLPVLEADSSAGQKYLADAGWAEEYARQSRFTMVDSVAALMRRCFGVNSVEDSFTDCCHNLIRREKHFGRSLWVHRKGANRAAQGERGLIPGSMGSESFHVQGRGNEEALCSSSHGAGRAMSRDQARRQISPARFQLALNGVWFDQRKASGLREESPDAYKDIRAVMRAQKDLVRIVRVLQPVLCYKGV